MTPKTTNWGIIGAGKIAHKFATDLATIPAANLYGIASRSLEKAHAFAQEYGFTKAFGSYEALLQDAHLDAVYIATPHVFHCEQTLMSLENKVAVLCEKPLAINSKEVQKMIAKAQETDTFLMEALWTLCLPHILKVKEIIDSGHLGALVSLKADFGFKADYDPTNRLFNPDLGGGSLLDIGIYPLLLSLYLFGRPEKITAVAYIGKTKVDEDCAVILQYKNEQTAHLHSTFLARTPTEAYIYCEKGYIHIPPRFYRPVKGFTILEYEGLKETFIPFNEEGIGYKYEAEEVMRCLAKNQKESQMIPHQFSIELMKLMDAIRKQIGLVYPKE